MPRAKVRDADDVLEADEILEVDEIAADPDGDDDWLSALDDLAPKSPAGAKSSAPPAPVAGRPKKKPQPLRRRRGSLRDADGEFPLWLSRLIMIGTGSAVGLFCVIVWAAIVAKVGVQTDWFAMVVGGMVGGGVRFGASKWDFGWFPAVTAAVIALVAIIGGKVYGVHTLRKEAAQEERAEQQQMIAMMKHDNYPIHLMAQEIIEENPEAADDAPLFLEWGCAPEELPALYGEALWLQATARWNATPENKRALIRAEIAQDIEMVSKLEPEPLAVNEHTILVRGIPIHFTEGSRTQVLSVLDFVFGAIALIAAFRIAAGFVDPTES